MQSIRALIVNPGMDPEITTLTTDVNGSFLHALQKSVGGHIESLSWLFEDSPCVWINEEGKLIESSCLPNLPLRASTGEILDILYGPVVATGLDYETGDLADITDAEIERFTDAFELANPLTLV